MAVLAFRVVPGLLFLLYGVLLSYQGARWLSRGKAEQPASLRDRFASGLFALGHVPAALYFGTRLLDPFYVHVPPVLRLVGVPLLLLGLVLLFAAHWALGKNWSPLLELRQGHTLTTRGPYRYLRHPMYAAYGFMGLGLLILSANWPVGGAFLGSLALLYGLRLRAEDDMLRDRFGDDFKAYAEATNRLVPRIATDLLRIRQIRAAVWVAGMLVAVGAAGCAALALDGVRDELGKADVAVVLGCRVHDNGRPGQSLRSRLNETVRLYREGWFPEILVSGGVGRNGRDEALVMRRFLVERGIPAERVHTDSVGVNTRATARNAAAFMRERDMDSAMVITQFYHVPRSEMALRNAGVPRVYGAHARFFEWHDFYAVPRELVAMAWYRVKTN